MNNDEVGRMVGGVVEAAALGSAAGRRVGYKEALEKVKAWSDEYKENLTGPSPLVAAEHTVIGLLDAEIDRLLEVKPRG